MFVEKLGKLYIHKGDSIVGVNFSIDDVVEIEGTEEVFDDNCELIEPFEARAKFNISLETPYVFPVESPVVDEVEEDTESGDNEQSKPRGRRSKK